MTSKADIELSRTRELLEQLRAKNDSLQALQAENDTLREENSALLKTNARQAILLQEVQGGMEHGNTTVNGETKEDLPPTGTVKKAHCSYISQKILLQFQPSVDPNDIPYEQIAWWKAIFSYIQPNDYERLHLRRLCNMFKAS